MVFICNHMHASILYIICIINSPMYTRIIIYTSMLSSYVSSIGIGLYHLITHIWFYLNLVTHPCFPLVECMVRFLDPFRFDGLLQDSEGCPKTLGLHIASGNSRGEAHKGVFGTLQIGTWFTPVTGGLSTLFSPYRSFPHVNLNGNQTLRLDPGPVSPLHAALLASWIQHDSTGCLILGG
jgi:hypothetical protein